MLCTPTSPGQQYYLLSVDLLGQAGLSSAILASVMTPAFVTLGLQSVMPLPTTWSLLCSSHTVQYCSTLVSQSDETMCLLSLYTKPWMQKPWSVFPLSAKLALEANFYITAWPILQHFEHPVKHVLSLPSRRVNSWCVWNVLSVLCQDCDFGLFLFQLVDKVGESNNMV